MRQRSITIAKCYSLFFLFILYRCPVVLSYINGLGALLNHIVIVNCQIPVALEQLAACNMSMQSTISPQQNTEPVNRVASRLYSSLSFGVMPLSFSSSSFAFFAASSLSNLAFQALKFSTVTGVPRVRASSA